MGNQNILRIWSFAVLVIAMLMVISSMESLEEAKEILRARRAAAPRSYMHSKDCKGVNRTFALMDDYPFCQSFVVCVPPGDKYIYDCPSGLWFNETSQECDYPENLEIEFKELCGQLINSFETDFYKQMAEKRKNKPISTDSQVDQFQKSPVKSKKRKQNIPIDNTEYNQPPEQKYDGQQTYSDDQQKYSNSKEKYSDGQQNNNEDSQPAVIPRRRAKPQPTIVTQSSENLAYEYDETTQESIKRPQPGHTRFPVEQNGDFEIPQQHLKITRPIQITQSPLQPVQGNGDDYYDELMPQMQPAQVRFPAQQINQQPSKPTFETFPQQPSPLLPQQPSQMLPQQPSQMFPQQPVQMFPQQPSQMFPQQPSQMFPRQPSQMFPRQPSQRYQQSSQQPQQTSFGNRRVQPTQDTVYDI